MGRWKGERSKPDATTIRILTSLHDEKLVSSSDKDLGFAGVFESSEAENVRGWCVYLAPLNNEGTSLPCSLVVWREERGNHLRAIANAESLPSLMVFETGINPQML